MVTGVPIPRNVDLKSDTYKIQGKYYCESDDISRTLQNCPLRVAFIMIVEYSNGYPDHVRQTIKQNMDSKIIVRHFHNEKWSEDEVYVTNPLAI